MTAKEAYAIARNEFPGKIAVGCLEFPDFFSFELVDVGMEDELFGCGLTTVNKTTGEIGCFLPQEDFKAFRAAKKINVKTLI